MTETEIAAKYELHGISKGPALEVEGRFEVRAMTKHTRWQSVITHFCPLLNEPRWIAPVDGVPEPCDECNQAIPEKIMTAWMLHNFEGIQEAP